MTENSFQLDASNLLCPMPVIKTQDRIARLQPGDCLTVICTDPGAVSDVPTWCRINGHQVLSVENDEQNSSRIIITIQVGTV